MKESRIANSLKNSISSIITYIILTIAAFVSQTVFIKVLGNELLGLNGLFTNILSMLSLIELGIGSAIIYNLYEPISNNKIDEVKKLMNFYKKTYNIITLIILVAGVIVIPFLPKIVINVIPGINITTAYILMLASTVSSYILSYKRSILYANQKVYIINIVHSIYLIVLNLLQIIILLKTKNYYLYLSIKIVFQLLENIILSIISNKLYPYIKEKTENLNKDIEKSIFIKVKAMLFHKIGGLLVFSTDNLIINKFLGLVTVGLYSNYNLIINSINNLVCKCIEAIIPSVGNLIAQNDTEKIYEVFKITRFVNFWISTASAICLMLLINPFITIWIGKKYLLNQIVVIILIISYYQKVERYTYSTFKNSAGIWETDKHIPIIEAVVNLIASVILAKNIGLPGVFIGTIISSLVIWGIGFPKYIYIPLFKKEYKNYFIDTIKQFLIFIIILILSIAVSNYFMVQNNILNFVINMIISLIIPNTILYVIYRNSFEIKYLKKIFLKIIK